MTGACAIRLGVLALLAGCRREPGGDLGRRLFVGELPLAGRITGHLDDLPPGASQCVNCHPFAPPSSDGAAQTFGPALDRGTLTQLRSRRGGPPSRYDRASFCRLLRTGIDPVDVVSARTMPRYALAEQQCSALWEYLSQRQP